VPSQLRSKVHCQMRRETGREYVMKIQHDEGVANRIEPEPCGFVREGSSEASVGAHGPAIQPRKAVLDADAVDRAEGGRVTASAPLVRRGRSPWRVRKLSISRNQEISCLAGGLSPPRQSVSGRCGAVAGDERTREVTLRHGGKKKEEGEVHRAPTPNHGRFARRARKLADLTGAYRAPPSTPVYIPKPERQRPLTIAALEGKIVQGATATVLNVIYEGDLLGFSYGFRSGRGQHDAMDALVVRIRSKKVSWILDADIENSFDTVSQQRLMRFVEHRVGDKRIHRLIQKWLKTGILAACRT